MRRSAAAVVLVVGLVGCAGSPEALPAQTVTVTSSPSPSATASWTPSATPSAKLCEHAYEVNVQTGILNTLYWEPVLDYRDTEAEADVLEDLAEELDGLDVGDTRACIGSLELAATNYEVALLRSQVLAGAAEPAQYAAVVEASNAWASIIAQPNVRFTAP